MILDRTPPPLYEMDLQFVEDLNEESPEAEGPKESYLQISVQSGVDPRVIRFIVPAQKYFLPTSYFLSSFHFLVC
jgi:hypothetical protein